MLVGAIPLLKLHGLLNFTMCPACNGVIAAKFGDSPGDEFRCRLALARARLRHAPILGHGVTASASGRRLSRDLLRLDRSV
jgi:hypothetical protein